MNIGEKIKARRIELKMTQKELGKILNVSQQMIGQWENSGNDIKLSTLGRIAEALDFHILDLLDDAKAIEYYDNVEEATLNYYNNIGYEFDFDYCEDSVVFYHNGYGYKISKSDFEWIFIDFENNAKKIVDKVLEKYSNTKFKL